MNTQDLTPDILERAGGHLWVRPTDKQVRYYFDPKELGLEGGYRCRIYWCDGKLEWSDLPKEQLWNVISSLMKRLEQEMHNSNSNSNSNSNNSNSNNPKDTNV